MEPDKQTQPDDSLAPKQPVIDTSKLFQKDEVAIPATKISRFKLTRKRLIVVGITLVSILIVSGVVFAQQTKETRQTKTSVVQEIDNNSISQDTSDNHSVDSQPPPDETTTGSSSSSDTSTPSTTGVSGSSGSNGSPTPPSSNDGGSNTSTSPKTYDISYTNNCYSPGSITIKKGDTVQFTNNSSRDMWPASDSHPSHTIYPEFDASSSIGAGGVYSFTFTKTGSWDYHDHLKPSCRGIVIVQ